LYAEFYIYFIMVMIESYDFNWFGSPLKQNYILSAILYTFLS
jgi:uncharacterized membrane protein (DUF485 family)